MSGPPPTAPGGPSRVVARYLDRLVAHDWDGVAGCLDEAVVRVGPFGDTYEGRPAYVAFLAGLMPSLEAYAMRLDRIVEAAGGSPVTAELTETLTMGGKVIDTPEVLVFDMTAGGDRIARIGIYIRRLPG